MLPSPPLGGLPSRPVCIVDLFHRVLASAPVVGVCVHSITNRHQGQGRSGGLFSPPPAASRRGAVPTELPTALPLPHGSITAHLHRPPEQHNHPPRPFAIAPLPPSTISSPPLSPLPPISPSPPTGADNNQPPTMAGAQGFLTPLHCAAICNHPSAIRRLVEKGANINATDQVHARFSPFSHRNQYVVQPPAHASCSPAPHSASTAGTYSVTCVLSYVFVVVCVSSGSRMAAMYHSAPRPRPSHFGCLHLPHPCLTQSPSVQPQGPSGSATPTFEECTTVGLLFLESYVWELAVFTRL